MLRDCRRPSELRRLFHKERSKALPVARMNKNVIALCFPKTLNGNQLAGVGTSFFW